jgi:hypothetical protein
VGQSLHELLVQATQVLSRPRYRYIFRTILDVHGIDAHVHTSSALGLYMQRNDTAVHGGRKLEICKHALTLSWPLGGRADNNRSGRPRRRRDKRTASPAARLYGEWPFQHDRHVMRCWLLAGKSRRKGDDVFLLL